MLPHKSTFIVATFVAATISAAEDEWQLVIQEDFASAECLKQWSLDGVADVSVTDDGKLRIQTLDKEIDGQRSRYSVLWHRTPVWGDVRYELDAKAEAKSRCLFFFCARSTAENKSVFAWKRPVARYGDYAYENRIELYTMGILRSDQTGLNLRHLGGDIDPEWLEVMPYNPFRDPERFLTPDQLATCMKTAGIEALPKEWPELRKIVTKPPFRELLLPQVERRKRVNADFQAKSIIASSESETPIFAAPEKFNHIVVTVRGAHVVIQVDGTTIIDHIDEARKQAPLAGGYFAFRNFKPTEAQYDNLRVYRLKR